MPFINNHPVEAACICAAFLSAAVFAPRQVAPQLEDPAVSIPESVAGISR